MNETAPLDTQDKTLVVPARTVDEDELKRRREEQAKVIAFAQTIRSRMNEALNGAVIGVNIIHSGYWWEATLWGRSHMPDDDFATVSATFEHTVRSIVDPDLAIYSSKSKPLRTVTNEHYRSIWIPLVSREAWLPIFGHELFTGKDTWAL